MTPSDLTARARSNVAPPPGPAQIDPLTLALLIATATAILSAVVEHYVGKCLDRLDHRTVANPGPWQKYQLWLECRRAARDSAGSLNRAQTAQATEMAYNALLTTGRQVTEAELSSLKGGVG